MEPSSWLLLGLVLAAIAGLWRLFNPPPRLVVGERGVLHRGLGLGWICWDEIEGAYRPSAHDGDALYLRVRLARPRGDAGRRGGTLDLRIDCTDTDLSPPELLREILARGRCTEPLATR